MKSKVYIGGRKCQTQNQLVEALVARWISEPLKVMCELNNGGKWVLDDIIDWLLNLKFSYIAPALWAFPRRKQLRSVEQVYSGLVWGN